MWFLNPGLLWALPLAASPVIVHLFFLRKARRVAFSDLTLLRKAYLKSLPASRLRQWLLLAVRCLLLAFLILAFARPVIQSGAESGAGPEDEVRLVMLVDTSYSMGYHVRGKTRLELTQSSGENILRFLRPQDKAAVAAFSDRLESAATPARLEWSKDIPAAVSALKRLTVGYRGTSYVPPLQAAYEFLKGSKAKRRVIVVLSDNAAHGWRGLDPARFAEKIPAYDPSVLVLGMSWQDSPENAAIIDGETKSAGTKGTQLTVQALLDSGSRQGWDIDLWAGSHRADQQHVNLSAGQELPVNFNLTQEDQSGVSGRVQLRRDDLPEDDVFYYSFWQQQHPKVLLISGGSRSLELGRGGYFLRKLFTDVQGSLLPYEFEIADSVRARELRLENYRAVMLIDFKSVPGDLAAPLERYVRGGGGLWVILAKGAEPRGYQSIAKMLPARIGDAIESEASQGRGIRIGQDLEEVSRSRFAWRDFELQNVTVRRSYIAEPASGSKIWFRDASGRPLLISGGFGEGEVLLWTSSFDIDWTNFGVKPVFAPCVDQAIGFLSNFSNRREWRTVRIGEPIVRIWSASEAAPPSVRIRTPQGKSVLMQIVQRKLQYLPETPGLYFIESSGGSSQNESYAVNLDRSTGESNLTAAAMPWKLLRMDSLRDDFIGALYGREVRTAALGFFVLLMLAETLLANPLGGER